MGGVRNNFRNFQKMGLNLYIFFQLTLMAATKGATFAIVKLIESGAEMQQCNDYGFTPLHAAAATGKAQAVELLLSRAELQPLKIIDQLCLAIDSDCYKHQSS